MRYLLLLTLAAMPALAEYPLGPFSHLAKYHEGQVSNGFFSVTVERGFKLHAILPGAGDPGMFGRQEYAGFLTLLAGKEPLYLRFKEPAEGTMVERGDAWHICVGKADRSGMQSLDLNVGSPFVTIFGGPADAQAGSTVLLTGFGWANKPSPRECELKAVGDAAPRKVTLDPGVSALPEGAKLASPLVLIRNPKERFQLAFVFTQSPLPIFGEQDGLSLRTPRSLQDRDMTAFFAVGILPGEMTWQQAEALVPFALTMPADQEETFAMVDGRAQVRIAIGDSELLKNDWAIPKRPATPLPPTLSEFAPPDAVHLPTLFGDACLCPGKEVTVSLPPVEHMDQVAPPKVDMPAEWRRKLNAYADSVVSTLRPEGGFRPSQGRVFYDGLTLSGLLLALPYLDEPLAGRVKAACRRTLDLWWNGLRQDGETGIWYFPEPVPALPVVDYPEISGTMLWPTVQYAATVDPKYPAALAGKIAKLADSLPKAYHWSGAAYAYPGPEINHIITESIIGGFVAWVALRDLAKMTGQDALSDQCAARAAFARQSMKLLRWRDAYGKTGIVSEMHPDNIKVGIAVAWDYTMYTWFSYVPAFELPRDDPYRIWATLEAEKWWDYSIKSRQRCYDFSHLMALARFQGKAEALKHLPEVADRPFEHDSFDPTEVYALMAYPWLAASP